MNQKFMQFLMGSFSILLFLEPALLSTQQNPLVIKKDLKPDTRQVYPQNVAQADKWPNTAPNTLEKLLQTGYPDPAIYFDLETTGKKPGNYLGPDGGSVSVYKDAKNWTWTLKNGIKVWSSPGSLITLSYGQHQIQSYRLTKKSASWNRRSIWTFPDGTQIIRYYNPAFKRFLYEYQNPRMKRIYDFFVFDDILTQKKAMDGFDFHFKPKYKHIIDYYEISSQRKEYNDWLASFLKVSSPENIPFLIFENEDEYNDYLQEKKRAQAGGRGFDGIVILCCGNSFGEVPQNKAEFETSRQKYHFSIMMHEMTHNRMKQACLSYEGYDPKNEKYTGHIYSEGMAEWSVSKVNTYYRDFLLKKASELSKIKKWDYNSLDDTSGKYYYPLMFAFWDYLEQNYGTDSLASYHRLSCLGKENDEASIAVWGKPLPALFSEFYTKTYRE